MKKVIREYEIYNFDELDNDIKEEVIENLYNINVDYNWWRYNDFYNEIAKDYGIEINMEEISFDLGRGRYVAFDTFNHSRKENWEKPIKIVDLKKFIEKAGLKYIREEYVYIDHNHYAGGVIRNYVVSPYVYDADVLNYILQEMLDKILKTLHKEYDYLTSEKAIIETIKVNEFTFLKNGTIFNK